MGDRFFLCDNKILCEYDYEERMVFANLAYNSSNLAQMKQNNRGSNNGPTNGPSGPKVSTIFQHIKKEVQNTAKCFDQLHLWEKFLYLYAMIVYNLYKILIIFLPYDLGLARL